LTPTTTTSSLRRGTTHQGLASSRTLTSTDHIFRVLSTPQKQQLLKPFGRLWELLDAQGPYFQATAELFQKAFPDAHEIGQNQVKELLEKGLYRVFISLEDNNNADTTTALPIVRAGAMLLANGLPHFPDACHLDYLFVNPALQGKGLGTSFLSELLAALKTERRYELMSLECYDELVGFYGRFSAKKLGVRPSQWKGHDKLYNFMVIQLLADKLLQQQQQQQQQGDLLLMDIREAHFEELDETLNDRFVWKTSFVKCK